jgi:hypothetical protein
MSKQLNFKSYTVKEFIEEYRSNTGGMGYIKVSDESPIFFNEIVCDSCNDEITQDKKNSEKKVIFVCDGYALCENCRAKWEKCGQ